VTGPKDEFVFGIREPPDNLWDYGDLTKWLTVSVTLGTACRRLSVLGLSVGDGASSMQGFDLIAM
jgi:hypothetical protein